MSRLTVGLVVCLSFVARPAPLAAQDRPFPWNLRGFQGYPVPAPPAKPADPKAAPVPPTQYRLIVTVLPGGKTDKYANRARIVAHLPENAQIYFQGQLMTGKGTEREFVSPPLPDDGYTYTYTVRVNWVERGKQVAQTHDFRVRAGIVHCIYLVKADSAFGEHAVVEKNLGKLSVADRELAEAQKFCAVQEQNRLGSIDKPVKITRASRSSYAVKPASPRPRITRTRRWPKSEP